MTPMTPTLDPSSETRTTIIETFAAADEFDPALPHCSEHAFPAHRLVDFESKWGKLHRRATKLGLSAPEWFMLRLEERTRGSRVNRFLVIGVYSSPIVLPGWSFVSTIQHTEHGNLIRTSPSFKGTVPAEYRTADSSWCDHCKAARRRNETFVVRHNNGELMRVGRNCLSDFIARDRDGASIAALMNWHTAFSSALDDLDGWGGSRSGQSTYQTEQYVAQVARLITEEGWRSRSSVRDDGRGTATADLAFQVYEARRKPNPTNIYLRDPRYRATDSDIASAKAALTWAQDIDPATDSDYLHNLRVACTFEYITVKEAGIVASVIRAHLRTTQREERKAREEAILAPIPDELLDGRHAFTGTILGTKWKETMYGETLKMIFQDERGFKLYGTYPSALSADVGGRVTFSATIQRSDDDATFGFFSRPTKALDLDPITTN